jgi:hypothetical protein
MYGTVRAGEIIALIDAHIGTDWKSGTASEIVASVEAATTVTLKALTVTAGFVGLPEITTPTAVPDFGTIYYKADNKAYFQDGAGVEHEVIIDDAGTVTLPGILAVTGNAGSVDFAASGNITGVNITASGLLITATKTPSAANDTGTAGTIAWDADFIYICVGTDEWERVAIASW